MDKFQTTNLSEQDKKLQKDNILYYKTFFEYLIKKFDIATNNDWSIEIKILNLRQTIQTISQCSSYL